MNMCKVLQIWKGCAGKVSFLENVVKGFFLMFCLYVLYSKDNIKFLKLSKIGG